VVVVAEGVWSLSEARQPNLLYLAQRYMEMLGVMGKVAQITQQVEEGARLRQDKIQMGMFLVVVALVNNLLTLPLMAKVLDTLVVAEVVLIIVLMQLPLVLVVLAVVLMAERLHQVLAMPLLLIQAVGVAQVVILPVSILVLVVLVL